MAEAAEAAGAIAADNGGSDFQWEQKEEERRRLWHARHNAYYAARALRPGGLLCCSAGPCAHACSCPPTNDLLFFAGCNGLITDICVPLSRLSECVLAAQWLCRQHNLLAPMVGHVGDSK